jgi:hypothetical protein
MKLCIRTIIFLVTILTAAGCSPETAEPAADVRTPAVQRLETYLQALVDKDEDTLVQLTCADWELNALLEFDAFGGVKTELDGLACEQTDSEDGRATVVCQGKIMASYQDEIQEFDLSGRTYQMVLQQGDWLVCGY